jgi:hypothetical protein
MTILSLLLLLTLAVGCSSTTRINFQAPYGSVMTVDGKPYHLPALIPLSHPSEVGERKRYPVSLVTNVQQRELRANGTLDVYGYHASDQDKDLTSTCVLDEENLGRLFNNTKVIFTGQTASRQHLYDLTLQP